MHLSLKAFGNCVKRSLHVLLVNCYMHRLFWINFINYSLSIIFELTVLMGKNLDLSEKKNVSEICFYTKFFINKIVSMLTFNVVKVSYSVICKILTMFWSSAGASEFSFTLIDTFIEWNYGSRNYDCDTKWCEVPTYQYLFNILTW